MKKKARKFGTAVDSNRTTLRFQNSNAAIPPLRILFALWVLCCGFVAAQSNDSSTTTASSSVSMPASSVSPALVHLSSTNVNSASTTTSQSLRNKTSILNLIHSSGFPIVGSTEPITLAISFVTTATPDTQSGAGSVRSLFDASSFSITGFTEPLTLALFTRNSLSQIQRQSNPSFSLSITVSDFVPSAQLSSKESSSRTQSVENVTTSLNLPESSSNSTAKESSFGFSAYTETPSLIVHSSSYILLNASSDKLSRNTVVVETSPSEGKTDASSSMFSFFNLSNTSLLMQTTSKIFQSTSSIAGSSPGTTEALNSVSKSSLTHISHSRTAAYADSTSVTESSRSIQPHISSGGRSAVTIISQAISQFYTSINAPLQTSQTNSVNHNSSKISDVVNTIVSLLPGGTTPTVTVQPSGSSSPSIQDPATSLKHIKHTVHDSSTVDSSSSQRESNSHLVSFNGVNTTAISQVTTMKYTSPLVNPPSPVSSTSHASMPLENSAIQPSNTQLNTVVSDSKVSSFSSVDSSESAEFLSSPRTSLPNSSPSFSVTETASNTSKSSETQVSYLTTKTFSVFVTATPEIPSRSSTLRSNTPIGNSLYSDSLSYSSSLESGVISLVSIQFAATTTKQLPRVSTVTSLASSSKITYVLTSSPKYIEPSTTGSTNESTFATQDLRVGSTAMFQSILFSSSAKTRLQTGGLTLLLITTLIRQSGSSLNVISTAHSLSTSANHSMRESHSFSGNSSVVDETTSSSEFITATPFFSSSGDGTDLPSLLQSTTLKTISTQISPSLAFAINSTFLTDSETVFVSYNSSKSHSSQDLLHSTSKRLENATSRSADSETALITASLSFPVSFIRSSHLASSTIHAGSESSLSPTELFSDKTSSIFGSKSLRKNSSESSLQQKSPPSSIIRTSLSVKELTSGILPTLTTSITISFSKSDSSASELSAQNFSSFPASSNSNLKQTSSKQQEVTLVTTAETLSRTTNQSVSVHESSSYLHAISSSTTRVLSTSHIQLSTATFIFGNSTSASSPPPSASLSESQGVATNSSTGFELTVPSSSKLTSITAKVLAPNSSVTSSNTQQSLLKSSFTEVVATSLETSFKTSRKFVPNLTPQMTPHSTQTVSVYTTMASVNSTMSPSPHSHSSSVRPLVTTSSTVTLSSTQQVIKNLSQTTSLKTYSTQELSKALAPSTNASSTISTYLNLSNTVLEYTSTKTTRPTVFASFTPQQSGLLSQISSLESSRSLEVLTKVGTLNMSDITASLIHSLSKVSVNQTGYSGFSSVASQVNTETNKSLTHTRGLETSQTERLTHVNPSVISLQVQTSSKFLVATTNFRALPSASRSTISSFSSEGRTVNATKSLVEQSRATPELSVSLTRTTSLAVSQTSGYTAVPSMNVSATPSIKGNLSSVFLVVATSSRVIKSPTTGRSTLFTYASSRIETSENSAFTSRSVQNSPTPTIATLDVATTASRQLHLSSVISIFTVSGTAISTLVRPSPTEQFVSSSVITIPSGIFVRFAVNVSLSTNINNVSFKAQMENGILATYENGSTDGTSGNITIEIVSIAREPNDSKVNVTFKAVNVSSSASASEPLPAYNVIQTMLRASLRLGAAVRYEVVEKPAIFYPSSTSSFSTMVMISTLSTSLKSINVTSVARELSAKTTFDSSSHSILNSTPVVYITPSRSYLVTSNTTHKTSTLVGVTSLFSPATYISSSTLSLPSSIILNGSSPSTYSKELTINSSSVKFIKTLFITNSISFHSESSSFRETSYLSSVAIIKTSAVTNSSEKASSVISAFTTVSLTQGTSAFKSINFNDSSSTSSIISPFPSSTVGVSNTAMLGSVISISLSISASANSTMVLMTKSSLSASLPKESVINQSVSFLTSAPATMAIQVTSSSKAATSNHSEGSSQLSFFLPRTFTSSYSVRNASATTLVESSAIIFRSSPTTIAVDSSKLGISIVASSSMRLSISSSLVETLATTPSKLSSAAYSTISFSRHSPSISSVLGANQTVSTVYGLPLLTPNVSTMVSGTTHLIPPLYSSEILSSSVGTVLSSSAETAATIVRVSTSISLLVNTTLFLNSSTSSSYNTAVITSNKGIVGSNTSSPVMRSSLSVYNVPTTRSVPQVSTMPTVTPVNLTTEVTRSSLSLSSYFVRGSSPSPSRNSANKTLLSTSAETMTSLNGTQTATRDLSSVAPAVTYAVSKFITETLLTGSTVEKQFTTAATSVSSASLGYKPIRSTVSSSATYLTSNAPAILLKSTLLILPSRSYGLTTSTALLQSKTTTDSKQVLSPTSVGSVLTTESFISTGIPGTRFPSLVVTTDVIKSSLTDAVVQHSVISSKSIFTPVQPTSYHSPDTTLKVSSAKDFITLSPMTTSSVGKQVLFTGATVLSSTETVILSRQLTLGPASITVVESSLETLPPTSMRSSMSSPVRDTNTIKKTSIATSLPQGSSSDLSSPLQGTSSHKIDTTRSITTLLTKMDTMTTKSFITSEKSAKATLVTEALANSLTSISKTTAPSTAKLLESTVKETTSIIPEGSYLPSKTVLISTSSTIELPTEPVRPTANANDTEGLVGIQILVPENEDENADSFRVQIESRLAEVFRWGQRKGSERKRRDVQHLNKRRRVHSDTRIDFHSRKRRTSVRLDKDRGNRLRREVDNITVLTETIRRAKAIVGEEVVDIEYRVFDGFTMLSAERIVETMNRLSEAEMVSTLGYGVTLRPYAVKKTQTMVPTIPPTKADLDWATIIPAIAVSSAVLLFLLCACIWVRCVGRKKKVNPFKNLKPKEAPYESLEVKVQASPESIPPKNLNSTPKVKRASSSSGEGSRKGHNLPDPDYSPYVTLTKPNQRYRRRTDDRDTVNKAKRIKTSSKEVTLSNGHVKRENHVKTSHDAYETIEMGQLAGVVENIPQFREEKLLYGSHGRQEKPLRFTHLPPLVKTSLVGKDHSDPEKLTELKKEKQRIIDESGVPQAWLDKMKMIELQKIVTMNDAELNEDEDALMLKANVERWRNKMLHREKLRQDMREKERKKDKRLKRLEKEERLEPDKEKPEDRPTTPRSLTAERKRRSRADRWRKNKVGTSSSKGTSSSSSSSSGSDLEEKRKDEKAEEKKRKLKEKEKRRRAKVPPLAIGQAAREAKRETAWTIKETPGVRLVSVRPHSEILNIGKERINQEWQPQAPESTPMPVHEVPQTRLVSPRRQQRDRVHYLLETGYPVWPMMTSPLVQPDYLEEEVQYEDMEGLDPYIPQYDQGIHVNGDTIPSVPPSEPREAFGGSTFIDDDHIYTEPNLSPASLPHTRLVNPHQNQTRPLVPTQYAHGYIAIPPVSTDRPTSASQHPGASRPVGSGRPTSARTEPAMPRYAPSPLRSSRPDRKVVSLPGSRYLLGNRPTVATAPQPSIGTSPRYMVDPERRQEPPNSYDGARMILARAKSNLDRFEQDSRVNVPHETGPPPVLEPVDATPQKKIQPHIQLVRGQSRYTSQEETHPIGNSRMEVSARERAELEAQLLVSRALARARANKITTAKHQGSTLKTRELVKERITRHAVKTKYKKKSNKDSSSSSSSSSSSEKAEKKEGKSKDKMKKKSSGKRAIVRPLPTTPLVIKT